MPLAVCKSAKKKKKHPTYPSFYKKLIEYSLYQAKRAVGKQDEQAPSQLVEGFSDPSLDFLTDSAAT